MTGDVAGSEESPVYATLKLNEAIEQLKLPEGYTLERYVASQPFLADKYAMKWDGEWHITYEVFRDLGIAFAVVVGAFIILFDPIFQGLAISLMAGEVASLLLSRMTVPILYYLSERQKHAGREPVGNFRILGIRLMRKAVSEYSQNHSRSAPSVAPQLTVEGFMEGRKREYETNEINETNEKWSTFRLFRLFRLFRILFLLLHPSPA